MLPPRVDIPLSRPARWFFLGILALTLVSGAILVTLPRDTETYFAWTIAEPMTVAFMGSAYLGGVANVLTLREDSWAVARVVVPAIFVLALTMLVATLLHLETFEWSRPVAWSWLATYIVYTIAGPLLWTACERRWTVSEMAHDLPGWFGPAMAGSAAVFAVVGLALFAAPDAVADVWPWALTPLTGRVVGGWVLESAALNAMLARQRSVRTASVALLTSAIVGMMLLLSSARLAASFDGVGATVAFLAAATFLVAAPVAAVASRRRA